MVGIGPAPVLMVAFGAFNVHRLREVGDKTLLLSRDSTTTTGMSEMSEGIYLGMCQAARSNTWKGIQIHPTYCKK